MKRFIYINKFKNSTHVRLFRTACKQLDIPFLHINYLLETKKIVHNPFKKGDVVYLYSNNAEDYSAYTITQHMLQQIKGIHLPNKQNIGKPLNDKYVQQHFLNMYCPSYSIPTYVGTTKQDIVDLVEKNKLHYPYIAKPKKGSKGHNVHLITTQHDLTLVDDYSTYIFQNFIKNTGDYRIHVLGKEVIGIMKRIPKSGEYRNNAAQGGTGIAVSPTSPIYKTLTRIAKQITKTSLHQDWVGLDIIYDEEKKQYNCLELNYYPQWEEFKKATGIDMAKEFLMYLKKTYK